MRIPLRMFLFEKRFPFATRYPAAAQAAGSALASPAERRKASCLDADRTGVADRRA